MPSLADLPDLTGFFSYSRRDDEHSQGSLSRLRAQIYNELRLQLGFNFKLWQDTEAIAEGTEWEDEIKRAISESVFFIPIVTPSSVTSKHCRLEFQAFLDREEVLGRKNLVFPLLYVRVPALENEELWRQDSLLGIIGRRQYFDWQKFRHRSFTEGEIAERIAQFCQNIVESLHQPWVSPAERRAAEEADAKRAAEQGPRDQEEAERLRAETASRQKAEQERPATEKGTVQSIADRARRDQEVTKQQEVETEVRQKAERDRWLATEAQRIAERAEQRQQQEARQSWAIRLIAILIGTVCVIASFMLVQSISSSSNKPANVSSAPVQSNPRDIPSCTSFRTTRNWGGKEVAILANNNATAAAAAESARSAAVQDGYKAAISNAPRRLEEVDVSEFLTRFYNINLIIICGWSPSPSFLLKLKTTGVIQ
jgi:flagellar biosynthesis GTPase FlhF